MEDFFKYLDNEIALKALETYVYQSPDLENNLTEEQYQYLIAFDYNQRNAAVDIQNYLFDQIVPIDDLKKWKVDKLLQLNDIEFPEQNLFTYAQIRPNFLLGKSIKANHYWTKEPIEIYWLDTFIESKKDNKAYLYLGSFKGDYVDIKVNEANEIWLYTNIDGQYYFSSNSIKTTIAQILFD